MVDDVGINKAATLERCVARVREEYAGNVPVPRFAAPPSATGSPSPPAC
jgi:hypothetical protein